jgi:hypothetical protein
VNELVQRLTQEQEIEATVRPKPTVSGLKEAIDRGYVHAKFPNTRGGTELGFPLDRTRSDLSGADFDKGTGHIKIVGELVLDYTRVRFHGTIDLATLKGTGRLEPLEDVQPGAARTA